MKKLVGLVVVLAALVLGGYYGMGMVTESTVKHNLEAVNKTNGLYVNILDYKRGWFTSTANLDWRLHIPERIVKSVNGPSTTVPAQDFKMQMPLIIYHGPVIFAKDAIKFGLGYARTNIQLPSQYDEKFNANFTSTSTKPVLDLSLFVNYRNNSKIEMLVPNFKLVGKTGGQLEWEGMTSNVNVTSDSNRLNGELTLAGIQFSKDDKKAVIGAVSSTYNLNRNENGLYLGDVSLSFPSLVIDNKTEREFELAKLEIHAKSNIENGLYHSDFKTSIEKIVVSGKSYGPGHLDMAIRNIDATVLAQINQQIKQAQQGTDTERQQLLLGLLPEVPKLFGRGAQFELSTLSFTMPEGTVEGSLLVSLPQGDSSNPFELIQKAKGNGKLKMPADVIKMILNAANKQKMMVEQAKANSALNNAQPVVPTAPAMPTAAPVTPSVPPVTPEQVDALTAQQLNAMVTSGLLVQDGNFYVITVAIDQGKVQINDKPFTPEMIKF